MPRRMIDPEIWRNEKVGSLPDVGRLLFIGIFSNADDDGRLKASPRYLKATIFPYDNDKTEEQVRDLRNQSALLGLIRLYSKNSQEYLDLPGWREHQLIRKDRYKTSKLPSYDSADEVWQPSGNQVATTDHQMVTSGYHSIVKSSLVKGNRILPTEVSAAAEAAPVALSESKQVRSEKPQTKKGQKPKQVETGVFLDMVEQHIGTKLVQRDKLQRLIRPLLVKFPEATPESLFECFKWLKENDPYCQARDSPMVVSLLPSKYPEWAAGKLPAAGGKEERHGKGQRVKGARPASDFTGKW